MQAFDYILHSSNLSRLHVVGHTNLLNDPDMLDNLSDKLELKVYPSDTQALETQHTNRVHARTRAVYAVLDQLPAEIRSSHYFDESLATQIGHDTWNIEIWLAHAEPLVRQGLAEAAQAIATGHQDIRAYFAIVVPPP
jgi:hypothetical protein